MVCNFLKRNNILTQISLNNTYTEKKNKKKEEDEDSKYYQIIPTHILYNDICIKISFLIKQNIIIHRLIYI
jgi:hypothetical protein